jgi:hypothetical protein
LCHEQLWCLAPNFWIKFIEWCQSPFGRNEVAPGTVSKSLDFRGNFDVQKVSAVALVFYQGIGVYFLNVKIPSNSNIFEEKNNHKVEARKGGVCVLPTYSPLR